MNTEYQPTIIETGFLIERLAIQFVFVREGLKRNWSEFKKNPRKFLTCLIQTLGHRLRNFLATPYVTRALSTAITVVFCIVFTALLIDRTLSKRGHEVENIEEPPLEVVLLNVQKPIGDLGIGLNGTGRVGFQAGGGKGEGSGPTPQHAQGGGSSGGRTPLPSQVGELPQPSTIPAPIPIAPPVNPPALPVAGIDIDPALWADLKEPVYGDPLSQSQIPSKGPGTGEGIGTNSGTGVGDGDGPGYGPGSGGNMGTGKKQIGYGGRGGSFGGGEENDGPGRPGGGGGGFLQRARVLLKPEPQYTEDARKNQITGTVVLKVVFASSGEVVQIRALRTLPFGLTERAIAAARQIKFEPAQRDGRAVSVAMQLEYNFNLY
jgi:TonB family protein